MNKRLAIFAKHGLVKMADSGDDAGGGAGDDGANDTDDKGGDKPPSPADMPNKAPATQDKGDDKSGLPEDPEQLQAMIKDLRKEAASNRTNAKTKAAEDARNALVQDLGKALGLVKDGDSDKLTPEQMTEQITQAQAAAREASVELAVFRSAAKAGGDPEALLDSRAFLNKAGKLDPSASDFDNKVSAAIKDAVKDNPKLKASLVGGPSSVEHAGGSGEQHKTQHSTLEGAVGAAYSK